MLKISQTSLLKFKLSVNMICVTVAVINRLKSNQSLEMPQHMHSPLYFLLEIYYTLQEKRTLSQLKQVIYCKSV